jgi:hypothetical protein
MSFDIGTYTFSIKYKLFFIYSTLKKILNYIKLFKKAQQQQYQQKKINITRYILYKGNKLKQITFLNFKS